MLSQILIFLMTYKHHFALRGQKNALIFDFGVF